VGLNMDEVLEMEYKQEYEELLKTGMAWEFHPWLTGMWEKDCDRFIKEVYSKYADTEDKD
jgi:hypothetical protein